MIALDDLAGDADYLGGRFAGAENDFGKAFAQTTMGIHLRKSQVSHRRRLERASTSISMPIDSWSTNSSVLVAMRSSMSLFC